MYPHRIGISASLQKNLFNMRVRIVLYEEANAWILGKFARKLNEELLKLGVNSDIAKISDDTADINHHIIYINYDETTSSGKDTLMVTHVDDIGKLNQIKRQLASARAAICMSKATTQELIMAGLPSEKLCYISPAHDQVIIPEPYTVGITSRVHSDGRKREDMLLKLSEHISPAHFKFKIMAEGWDDIIKKLRQKGFEVTYYPFFIYDEYVKLIPSLDYYLYFGNDEGSMGFIDALAAGVKTIVTPQGYHLDADHGIVHSFNTMTELITIFNSITADRQKLFDSVATWTWRHHALKHLELWNHLLNPDKQIESSYKDGVNSFINKEKSNYNVNPYKRFLYIIKLYKGALLRRYHKLRKIKNIETFKKKLNDFLKK